MTDSDIILQNYHSLQAEIRQHAMDPDHPPKLLPVTKTQDVSRILPLASAGVCQIGENRVQEIISKYIDLSAFFDIHLIGRLQTNKIKYIIGKVCMVHSLDRGSLAEALHAQAMAHNVVLDVLVQVNIGEEPQKAGLAPVDVEKFLRDCSGLAGISVRGLMTVMPFVHNAETIRPLFREMRMLFLRMRALGIEGVRMDELSMGMSGDFRVAAQEGATIVRVGSAIFGSRQG